MTNDNNYHTFDKGCGNQKATPGTQPAVEPVSPIVLDPPLPTTPEQTNVEQVIERLDSLINAIPDTRGLLCSVDDSRASTAWGLMAAASDLLIAASQTLKRPNTQYHNDVVAHKISRATRDASASMKFLSDNL